MIPTYLPALRYGGPIIAVHGLCRALAARGHDVHVLTTDVDGPGRSEVPLRVPVPMDGVRVTYFPCRHLVRLARAPALARHLAREIDGFDLVHSHSIFLWPGWAAAKAARRAGIPYVISPRGMLIKDLIARRSPIVKAAWLGLIERRNLERAAAIHATSDIEAAELSRFGWRLAQIATIPNGVDDLPAGVATAASEDVEALARHQPFVLFFGRLSWKKGVDRLIRAFALTRSGTLLVAGTDDERLAPQLARLADSLGVRERVRFLPRTLTGADKERLFAAARMFVLPSYSENFGNTVLEALQRGVPAIVTPEVGASEVVRAAGAGMVVAGDAEPLGAAIEQLIERHDLARGFGDAGARYVRQHHAWSSIAAAMEALYESIRSRHRDEVDIRSGAPAPAGQ